MDATEEEVARQLWKEQLAQGERLGGVDMQEREMGSASMGVGVDAESRGIDGEGGEGGSEGGFAGYANAGLGNGSGSAFGVGSGTAQFGGRESGLEENEVVLEGPLLALREALAEGRFSDLTIFHGVRVWNAHKVVVCSQSPVLESMIDNTGVGNMHPQPLLLPTRLRHCITRIPLHVRLLDSLSPPNTSPSSSTYLSGPTYSLPLHEQIFYLASHLQIPALETLAAVSFRHTLHTQISDLDIYFDCVKRIYGKTTAKNPGLRNALVEAAVQELEGLLENEEVKGKLWRVMSENGEFWEDVIRTLGSRTEVRVREVIREVRVPVEVEKIVEKIVERDVLAEAKEEGEADKEWTLCPDCGPRDEGEEYEFRCTCRECGVERILSFS
ncbi:hypothetical protein H4I96_09897 [Botrytis cinerea]